MCIYCWQDKREPSEFEFQIMMREGFNSLERWKESLKSSSHLSEWYTKGQKKSVENQKIYLQCLYERGRELGYNLNIVGRDNIFLSSLFLDIEELTLNILGVE